MVRKNILVYSPTRRRHSRFVLTDDLELDASNHLGDVLADGALAAEGPEDDENDQDDEEALEAALEHIMDEDLAPDVVMNLLEGFLETRLPWRT
jgi:hypothetical protein